VRDTSGRGRGGGDGKVSAREKHGEGKGLEVRAWCEIAVFGARDHGKL
jgi:hypothetical protein